MKLKNVKSIKESCSMEPYRNKVELRIDSKQFPSIKKINGKKIKMEIEGDITNLSIDNGKESYTIEIKKAAILNKSDDDLTIDEKVDKLRKEKK